MVPAIRDTNIYSGFVQDQIILVADRLSFTIGAKLEQHPYSVFTAMPSARIAWTPNTKSTYWAAVSRASRAPSDMDAGMRVVASVFHGPGGLPVEILNTGNPQLQNEYLLAYEAGYRTLLRKNLSADLAAYYHSYDDLETRELSASFLETNPAPPHLVMPLIAGNMMHGESHGLEVFANWHLLPCWTLSPGYAFERIHLHLDPGSLDSSSVAYAGEGTRVQSAQLPSHVSLPHQLSWDTSVH